LANLIEKIAIKMLARHKQKDKSEKLRTLSSSRDIGIVYNVKNTEAAVLNKVVHFFESNGKNVITLGYISEKDLGDYVPNYKEEYFCKKDLNFWKLPRQESLTKFINKDFDFLINLDVKGSLQLQAVSTYSKAKTRIGKHFDGLYFSQDFMIKGTATHADDLFKEIKTYLK
jgi:hypothetical protein